MVVLSFSSFLIMGMGRGVVVINTCGFVPNRRANSKLSHTACGYWNFASSSIHAVSNCERSLVATGQTDGEVQPVGGGQPARWPKAKPGDRFRYVAAQHLALDA